MVHLELIAHPPDRLDVIALLSHLAAELLDMGINCTCVTEIIVIPNIIKNRLPGKCQPLILHEVGQQLKLLEAEFQLLPIDRYGMRSLVDRDTADLQNILRAGTFRCAAESPQLSPPESWG